MKTVYINESGIRPWESIRPINDARFTTTTLVDYDFNSVWESWCSVMDHLSEEWPIKREWTSTTAVGFNSKAEEYLFKKYISNTLTTGDLCKKMKTATSIPQLKTAQATLEKYKT